MAGSGIIDVWNAQTFDAELMGDLDVHADLIRNHMTTARRLWIEREASDHTSLYPENPYSRDFLCLKEHIMRLMEGRTIRAWHYTRMTDDEIAALRHDGIYLSTLDTIRARFSAQVAANILTQNTADRLFEDSPFQSRQLESRSNKFWMVSHPHQIEDSGVKRLLASWGGESAYFWQRDPELQTLLTRIGRARVVEISMPLSYSNRCYLASEAVVATFGRTLGCRPDKHDFDLYSRVPLGAEHILAVHSEGEPNFETMARGYPSTFVDLS